MGFEATAVVVVSAALGLLVGSFLNVVIIRIPRRESIVRPRSHCVACGETIRWYDNVPVVSYLVLRGRCRYCDTRISSRYAIVEALTALLFVSVAWRVVAGSGVEAASILRLSVFLYLTAALVASTFIDLEHQIIPDSITIPGMVLAPILSAAVPSLHGLTEPLRALGWSLVGILAGALGTWLVGVLGKLVFRKEAMGFGDVKLMGMIGGLLGWKGVLLTFLLACVLGSVIGLVLLAVTRNRYLPFAPYLSAGAMIVIFFGNEIEFFLTHTYPAWIRGWLPG